MKLNNYEAINNYLYECVTNIYTDNNLSVFSDDVTNVDVRCTLISDIEEMTALLTKVISENTKTEPFNECFYTGGGIFIAVHQFGGADSDTYCTVSSDDIGADDNDKCLTFYSHEEDMKNGFYEQYGMYGVIYSVGYNEMNLAEKEIYNNLVDLINETM